jgi:hypothetical protein
MITKEKMLPLLIEICPSFSEKWQEHQQEYKAEEAFLPYVALGAFASHLVELYKQSQTNEFEKVFEVVEKLHIEGDDFVKEAATIGLLESLQNHAEHNSISHEAFEKYLHSVSAKYWKELNKFWNGEIKYVGQSFN